jgi:hypothetical protein
MLYPHRHHHPLPLWCRRRVINRDLPPLPTEFRRGRYSFLNTW